MPLTLAPAAVVVARGAKALRRGRLPFVSLLVITTLGGACGETSEKSDPDAPSASGEEVTLTASDGVTLAGTVFGDGAVGVVMAHMGRSGDTQADWFALARSLAERGYLVVTVNRRGVCGPGRRCSKGVDDYANSWKDVVGAVEFVRSRGAQSVVLVGASVGAMASLHASVIGRVKPAALIEIGGVNRASGYEFSREQLQRLDGAKLFVSSARDGYGAAYDARDWHSWAKEPKRLVIFPGDGHGTDMLRPGAPTARPLTELVLDYVTRRVPPRPVEDG